MIRKILTTYAARLDEYLARSHRQPEGVAEVGLIGSAGEQCPNKLVVSLVNLEREASGDGGYMQRAATGYAGRRQSLQFGRLRSNRFGENGLTDACRAVFSKQAAPRSHAFFSCHEPLPPDSRCGELRGGLSSRPPGVGTATCNFEAAAESACRQYRAARWFLLPEGELRARQAGSSRLQVFDN